MIKLLLIDILFFILFYDDFFKVIYESFIFLKKNTAYRKKQSFCSLEQVDFGPEFLIFSANL